MHIRCLRDLDRVGINRRGGRCMWELMRVKERRVSSVGASGLKVEVGCERRCW